MQLLFLSIQYDLGPFYRVVWVMVCHCVIDKLQQYVYFTLAYEGGFVRVRVYFNYLLVLLFFSFSAHDSGTKVSSIK